MHHRLPEPEHAHHSWVTAICLDVAIVLFLGAYYAAATHNAPMAADPTTGKIFQFLVPTGMEITGSGKRAIAHTVFGAGYVNGPTLAIGWLLIANGVLIIGAILNSFWKQLGEPPPPP
jgi:hypothetical protein